MKLRRFAALAVCAVLFVVTLWPSSGAIFAQEPLELDATVEDPTGYFTFNYPSSWSSPFQPRFEYGRLDLSISVNNNDNFSAGFSGLVYVSELEAAGADIANGDLIPALDAVRARGGLASGFAVVGEPENMTIDGRAYAEIILEGQLSDGSGPYYRSIGLLEIGDGYYIRTNSQLTRSELDVFLEQQLTARAIFASLQLSEDAIPPSVPFEFDPTANINTDLLGDDAVLLSLPNDDGGDLTLSVPVGYDGTVYATDFVLDGPYLEALDVYGPYIYGLVLEEGVDYDFEFTGAADFLQQAVLDEVIAARLPFAQYDFITGLNTLSLPNGELADIVYRVETPVSVFYNYYAVLITNNGEIISVSADFSPDYVNDDAAEALTTIAEIRAILGSIAFEGGGAGAAIDTSSLATDPLAVAAADLLTSSTTLETDNGTLLVNYPAEWSADAEDNGLSLYSNANVFGSGEESVQVSILAFTPEFEAALGVTADMSPSEAANAVLEVFPTLFPAEINATIIADLQPFAFENTTLFEFVYTFEEFGDFTIEAVGVFSVDGQLFFVTSQLRTTGIEELDAFYAATSLTRAVIASLQPIE